MTNTLETRQLPAKEILFQNKEVVITGGAAGIGRALADRFAQLGSIVTILDISLPNDLSDQISFIQLDVTDQSQFEQKLQVHNIDVLIIAAGVTSQTKEPTDEEKKLMDGVNVDGVKYTLDALSALLSPAAQIVYIGTDNPPKAYYKQTKEQGAQIVKDFSVDHPHTSTTLTYVGPVRTELFKAGKSEDTVARIEQEVGLYEPSELAEEIIDDLVEKILQPAENNLHEKVMYKKVAKKD